LQIAITISQFAIKASRPKKYLMAHQKVGPVAAPSGALIAIERTACEGDSPQGKAGLNTGYSITYR
jgi:hypothetical protein